MQKLSSIGQFRAMQRRRGMSIVLVAVTLIALLAFVSLAVDIGRMRLAKAQMQAAADSAAMAGARALATRADTLDTPQDVINEAILAAMSNKQIGTATPNQQGWGRTDSGMVIDGTKDVYFGNWNKTSRTFTAITNVSNTNNDDRRGANAVQVKTWRTTGRGNALKLIFAPVLGIQNANLYAEATAYITDGNGGNFGFIGLNSVKSNGNKATINGGVASDGKIDLGNGDVKSTASVVGDARPGKVIPGVNPPPSLDQGPNSVVDGWTANLDYNLAELYKPILAAPGGSIPIPANSTNYTFTGGSDPLHRVNFTGVIPKNFTVIGYIRIYFTNPTIDLKHDLNVTWQQPVTKLADRLELFATGMGVTEIKGNANTDTYAHIYAPQADVEIGGGRDFYGWAIGKTLSFTGNSTFTYDDKQRILSGHQYKIHLVK